MTDLPTTRQSLLLKLERKSDDAWSEFLEIYETAIYRVCRTQGLQHADALDVTQEVLATVHRRVSTWDHDPAKGTFRGWLLRVSRNISIDAIRDRSRRSQIQESAEGSSLSEFAAPEEAGQSGFDLEYQRSVFEWAAKKVRDEVQGITWEAFQLTTVLGLSAKQASERLSIPLGSVYTAKCRVVARIREKVNQFDAHEWSPPSDLENPQ